MRNLGQSLEFICQEWIRIARRKSKEDRSWSILLMTVVAATFGALSEVQMMHAIYLFKAQEVNNPMLQTVRDSELKRRSCSHYKSITLKCCWISPFVARISQHFCTVRCFSFWRYTNHAARRELGTSRWKPNSQPGEDSSVLRNNFAALLGVCEISQTPFFSCEMAPEASRKLLPTLGDIFH